MTRRKKPLAMRVGAIRWDSYKPGKRRLYQLQKVVNKHGSTKALSPRMTAAEAKVFVRGWNKALGKRKGKISFKRWVQCQRNRNITSRGPTVSWVVGVGLKAKRTVAIMQWVLDRKPPPSKTCWGGHGATGKTSVSRRPNQKSRQAFIQAMSTQSLG